MIKHYHPRPMNIQNTYFFILNIIFLFALVHYSIWQRADSNRSSIPFTEPQFFIDFYNQPIQLLDPFFTILSLTVIFSLILNHIFKLKRTLNISDQQISWSFFGIHYKIILSHDIQQVQYIAIPTHKPNLSLLRIQTKLNHYDLHLSQFSDSQAAHIIEQLAVYNAELIRYAKIQDQCS